jgi:hypothetical protein
MLWDARLSITYKESYFHRASIKLDRLRCEYHAKHLGNLALHDVLRKVF